MTFKVKNKRIHDLTAGIRMSCIPMRLQYEFLIPKYPIGTFTIYSCLGGGTFNAKAR